MRSDHRGGRHGPAHRLNARAGSWQVDGGTAQIEQVPGTHEQWVLRLDGIDQSHVDLADPTHLAFDYVRWIGAVVDLLAAPGVPRHTVHIGAGAGTLARFVAATRPGSRQIVLDPDAPLLAVVRESLGLRSAGPLKVRCADGREGLAAIPDGRHSLVIRDAFAGMAVPVQLSTTGFVAEVDRVLAADGCYVANLSDRAPFTVLRAEAATALSRWRHVVAITDPATLRGRRTGNVLLVAAHAALPLPELSRSLGGPPGGARVIGTRELIDRVGGRPALRDGDAAPVAPVRPSWV